MNKVNISIYDDKFDEWIDYTKYTALPFKGADIYDEQLDECELQLERISVKAFTPLSKVKIEIVNTSSAKFSLTQFNKIQARCDNPQNYTFIHNNDGTITVKRLIYMFVANDNAEEKPIGSDKYSHKIYLIELTKLLEGFIGDTITFTNPLGNNYIEDTFTVGTANCYFEYNENFKGVINNQEGFFISAFFPNSFKYSKNGITFPLPKDIRENETLPEKIIFPVEYPNYRADIEYIKNASGENIQFSENSVVLELGTYTIGYHFNSFQIQSDGYSTIYYNLKLTYTFSVYDSLLPPKKWTITDVINRVLETVEPLRIDESPRFYLKGIRYIGELVNLNGNEIVKTYPEFNPNIPDSTAEKLDKILAPEFAFSKMTAREMLQQIGGRIHAEPRLLMRENDNSKYYTVDYDFYGLTKKSHISERPHILSGSSIDINNYCTSLDSSADNLINSLDYAQNVIIEPFIGGYKTVRAEQVAIRMSESDGGAEIETTLPIYLQPQVTVKYNGETYDISAYVFEKTDYDNLSSYDGTFPYAKAYALYYEQGKKNIKGLFFKAPDAVNPVFKKYAISNIIKAVTGENVDFALGNGGINTDALLGLEFQVSYLPIVQQRVKTNKSIVNKGLPRTIAYNQGANSIETRYYGENLKGVISRLGNVEKTYTYALAFISDIPQIGTKFDDTYYITNVAYEILPTYIRCTVALSENFNRHSEYVGINSEKRMWEVSERQALERDYIKTEYLYITASTSINSQAINPLLAIKPLTALLDKTQQKVSLATVKGYTKQLNPIRDYYLAMPVVASSFGNAMTFSFAFEDNCWNFKSAGIKIVPVPLEAERASSHD